MKIGVVTDCLKLPLEQALLTARRLGIDGVQIYATTGIFNKFFLSCKGEEGPGGVRQQLLIRVHQIKAAEGRILPEGMHQKASQIRAVGHCQSGDDRDPEAFGNAAYKSGV